MAKKKSSGVGQIIPERIMDWSGGQNNAVNVALLNDNESRLLQNYSLDEKGTLFPFPGSLKRYAAYLGASPVSGMGKLYKSDGTSRFLIGLEDGKLYVDSPHMVNQYDTQAEFNGGGNFAVQADAGGKLWPMIIKDGFESGLFDDWHTHDSGWTIDSTVFKSGAKSAKGTGANQILVRSFGFNSKQLKITLYARFGETTREHYIGFLTSIGNLCYPVVAYSDGHFKYFNGSAYTNYPTDKTYSANTWYKIEIYVRDGYVWISIDDVCLTTSGLALKDGSNNAVTELSSLRIATDADNADSNTWLDDIEINLLAPVFSRDSVAWKKDGTQVAANAPRFETVGSVQGVMVEEGKTNIVVSPLMNTDTNADGVVNDFTSSTSAVVTAAYVVEDNAQKINVWASTGDGNAEVSQNIPISAGEVASVQVECRFGGFSGSMQGRIVGLWYNSSNVLLGSFNSSALSHTVYQVIKLENKTAPANTAYLKLICRMGTVAAGSTGNGWFRKADVEKKPYCTSFVAGTRSAEVLTIPTAGVFNKGNWAVDLKFTPKSLQNATYNSLLQIYIDSNNYYNLTVGTSGFIGLTACSGGIQKNISNTDILLVDQTYYITIAGDNNAIRLCMNGTQIGIDTAYTEPVGNLPANIYIGSSSTPAFQANGVISDLRISSRARTLAEHQAAYNSGQPLTADNDTTMLLLFNGNLNTSATHHWISPAIDCSNATDQLSGHAALTTITPGASNVTVYSRSAPAITGPWTAWVAALGDGSLQHAADDYVQVKLILARDGENDPYVDSLTVSFDGQATATLLASDFSPGKQFFFDQLNDLLAVMTGDAPKKYDGTTLAAMGGSPPHAPYGVAHKNRFWMAKGSRLYFSDLLNVESWPVLNFIDIMPNDGDEITGMITFGDYLIIAKGHSVWMLIGETINTFRVRRIHSDRGCYAPRSLCIVNQMLCFVSDDGIYFSDFTQPVLISERIRKTWDGLNKRRLNLIASWFFDHKLYVAVPDAGQQRNNRVLVYDSLRQAFAGDRIWPVSCWTDFREAGEINSFFGRSDLGNVRKINTGYNDDGAVFEAIYESKAISHGAPEILKRYNIGYLQVKPAALDAELIISFIVDGVETPTMTVPVPANATGLIETLQIFASEVGVISGHRIQVKIRQQILDNPLGIQSVYLEALPLLIAPTLRG